MLRCRPMSPGPPPSAHLDSPSMAASLWHTLTRKNAINHERAIFIIMIKVNSKNAIAQDYDSTYTTEAQRRKYSRKLRN